MSRKIQEDLIFPREIFKCESCNEENAYFVIVKPFGCVVWGGALCPHVEKNKIGEKIKQGEAKRFLETEKKEAEKFCTQVTGETRTNILQYISNVNNAISRIKAI